MSEVNTIARAIINLCPELKPSFLDKDFILWKYDENGVWTGLPAVKDPNYKGHRYIWEKEIQ